MRQFLVAGLCLLLTFSVFANPKATEAAEAYSQRDFNPEGVKKVEEAVRLYQEAIAVEADEMVQLNLQLDLATAHYFLGTAMDRKDDRKAQHQSAMDVADAIMVALGVDANKAPELSEKDVTALKNKMTDEQEAILAEAMYSKGINLAQWGNLKGIPSSIGRLPVVLGLMERIEMFGQESISEYGPYRTIGRIKFSLPKVLGGDLNESEDFLKRAYRATLVEGQRYSINGYNNIYLAETLYKMGKENQAKNLLELFLKADPTTLKADNNAENREALRVAQELMDDWN